MLRCLVCLLIPWTPERKVTFGCYLSVGACLRFAIFLAIQGSYWAWMAWKFSEAASCQLEFKYLAKLTGRKGYYEKVSLSSNFWCLPMSLKAERAMDLMYNARTFEGLFSEPWSPEGTLRSPNTLEGRRHAYKQYNYTEQTTNLRQRVSLASRCVQPPFPGRRTDKPTEICFTSTSGWSRMYSFIALSRAVLTFADGVHA